MAIIGGIISILCLIIITIILIFLSISKMKPQIDRWLDIKNKEVQTKEYEMFMEFDTENAIKLINDYIDDYIANYSLYNFALQDKEYIGQEDAEIMIKEITKTVVINLSELYLFYIKMLRGINSDEDLILYIRDIVKERALIYITETNKPT